MTWWHGMVLVLGRGLREQLRSKTFKIVTALMLLLSIGAVLVPKLVTAGPTTYTLATVGPAPAPLTTSLDAAARATDVHTAYVVRTDEAGVRSAVQHGEATVGLAGDQMYVAERTAGAFPGIVAQSLVRIETRRLLTGFGLTPSRCPGSIRAPSRQVFVAPVEALGRAGVGFAVGLVLYLALLFSGQIISMTVATEKASRISEVAPGGASPQPDPRRYRPRGRDRRDDRAVRPVRAALRRRNGDRFLLAARHGRSRPGARDHVVRPGFHALRLPLRRGGALVDKVTEAGTAVLPVTALIIAGYLLGVTVVMGDPNSTLSVAVSLFPLTAPLTMPIRWAAGEVPIYQLLLALGLTAADRARVRVARLDGLPPGPGHHRAPRAPARAVPARRDVPPQGAPIGSTDARDDRPRPRRPAVCECRPPRDPPQRVGPGPEGVSPIDVLRTLVVSTQPRQLIEIGCGTGQFARSVLDEAPDVDYVATDLSPAMVEATRALGVTAEVAPADDLPFADGSFDGAVAAWMLYHVPGPRRARCARCAGSSATAARCTSRPTGVSTSPTCSATRAGTRSSPSSRRRTRPRSSAGTSSTSPSATSRRGRPSPTTRRPAPTCDVLPRSRRVPPPLRRTEVVCRPHRGPHGPLTSPHDPASCTCLRAFVNGIQSRDADRPRLAP